MKFFGAVEPTRADDLSLAIERAAKRFAPFGLDIDGAGTFPPHASTRVLWLGVQDTNGHLARLYQILENECAIAGFKRDERRFHPHITIARLRHPAGARILADLHLELGFPSMDMPVNEIALMKSELGPKGSSYAAMSRHYLAR
jgi:2'-5' RNA ligase